MNLLKDVQHEVHTRGAPVHLAGGAQGGTSACSTGAALSFVRASRAGPLAGGGCRAGPLFLARSAGDPPPASWVLVRLSPQPRTRLPSQTTIVPCPLSEPDVRVSRIRLPTPIFTQSASDSRPPDACQPEFTGSPSLCTAGAPSTRHGGVTSFPPPALPGFIGTIR